MHIYTTAQWCKERKRAQRAARRQNITLAKACCYYKHSQDPIMSRVEYCTNEMHKYAIVGLYT